jgi:predicted lysophospholipase L1 biosynthesis ABC-type transport system permease subunit
MLGPPPLALGARRGEVKRMFLGQALVLAGAGLAVGLAVSAGPTRVMSSPLSGVSPLDLRSSPPERCC